MPHFQLRRLVCLSAPFAAALLAFEVMCMPVASWSGEFPGYGYVCDLAIDPSEPDIVYAAMLGAGLLKSTNAGEEWFEINKEAGIRKYHVVVIDPQNPARLYAGGEQSGVWISDNKGESWRSVGPDTITVCCLAVDPTNSNRVFVLEPKGVWRNTDIRSSNWEHVFDYQEFFDTHPLPYPDMRSMEYTRWQKISINPYDPSEIYAGVRMEGGFHVSRDGGDTWSHECMDSIFARVDLVLFHPFDPNILVAATHHQGVFKSFNGGRSWIQMSQGIEPQRRSPYYGATVISGLTFDQVNPEIMYTGSSYLNWKTTDGGLTWNKLDKTLTCEYTRSFAIDPVRPNIVYAGSNVGVYRSMDGGETWEYKTKGFPELELVNQIQITFDNELFQYGIDKYNRFVFRRSLSRPSDWEYVSLLLYDKGIDSLAYDQSNQVLTVFGPDGVFRSYDGGYTWDVPIIEYASYGTMILTAPFVGDRNDSSLYTFDLYLEGRIFIYEQLIDPLYRRPPYVHLQLVTLDYPFDESVPLWTQTFDIYLKSTIQIPKSLFPSGKKRLLFAQVRDFQRNRQFGCMSIGPDSGENLTVALSPEQLLPAFTTNVTTATLAVPHEYELLQNYPNPFNASTQIVFRIPKREHMSIMIHDILGRNVKTLVDGRLEPGEHRVVWDGTADDSETLPSGLYFAVMETAQSRIVRKATMLR